MGCGESRVKRISLTSEQDWEGSSEKWENSSEKVVTKQLQVVQELSVSALQPQSPQEEEPSEDQENLVLQQDHLRHADLLPLRETSCVPKEIVHPEHHGCRDHHLRPHVHHLHTLCQPRLLNLTYFRDRLASLPRLSFSHSRSRGRFTHLPVCFAPLEHAGQKDRLQE